MENYEEINQNSNTNQNSNDNTSATVSMVLGIISVVLCWVPIIGLILAIIALVLAVKGLKKSKIINKGKGFSITGISCGSVGIALNIIYTIVWIAMGFVMKYTYDVIENEVDSNLYRYNSSYNRNYDSDYNDISDILDDFEI
ncbi:MAG: hypothetical protein J6A89_08385 [Clostridia bacterium]|nr:hypothetical protein [Clostridia bacterium]